MNAVSQTELPIDTTPDELRRLADAISITPEMVWRMQTSEGAYCMEWTDRDYLNPQREAQQYYAERIRLYPETSDRYQLKEVEVLSAHGQSCRLAAAVLRQLACQADIPLQ